MECRRSPRCDHHLDRRHRPRDVTVTSLLTAARCGDQQAWTELVRRFSPIVRRRTSSMTSCPELAEDAVQNAWLKLALSLDAIREPERLAGWLCTTARNELINMVRRDARLVLAGSDDQPDPPVEIDLDAAMSAEQSVDALSSAFRGLSERQQALIRRRYLTDEPASYAQIAEQLDMRPGAIGPTLGRALDRMAAHPEVCALR